MIRGGEKSISTTLNEEGLPESYFLFLSSKNNEWNQMGYVTHIIRLLGYFSVSKNSGEFFFFHFSSLTKLLAFHFLLASELMCVDGRSFFLFYEFDNILNIVVILFSNSKVFALGLSLGFSGCHVVESKHSGRYLILIYR